MSNRNVLLLMLGVALVSVLATITVISRAPQSAQNLHTSNHKGRHDMEFKVADNLQELVFTSEPRCKKRMKKKGKPGIRGCFKVDKKQRGVIHYKFTGKTGWSLQEFKICKGFSKNRVCSPADLPVQEFRIAASKKATQMFGPNDDGSIDLSQLPASSNGSVDFYLFDENTVKQDYYYSISACPTTTGTCIWTDPPIVNRGGRR